MSEFSPVLLPSTALSLSLCPIVSQPSSTSLYSLHIAPCVCVSAPGPLVQSYSGCPLMSAESTDPALSLDGSGSFQPGTPRAPVAASLLGARVTGDSSRRWRTYYRTMPPWGLALWRAKKVACADWPRQTQWVGGWDGSLRGGAVSQPAGPRGPHRYPDR